MSELATWLDALPPVDLETVDATAELQTRKDRKYVVDTGVLLAALRSLDEPIRILEIDGQRQLDYESVYFDSPHLDARGRPKRFKVRARTYLDHPTTMLEVKTKNRAGATVKHRVPFDGEPEELLCAVRSHAGDFVESAPHASSIVPSQTCTYRRTTLLLPRTSVRVTIDAGYRAVDATGRLVGLPDELIVETKTSGRPSTLDRCLWAAGERPVKLSKYATGMAALRPDLPANRWHRVLQRHFDPVRSGRGPRRNDGPVRAKALAAVLALLLVAGCSSTSPTEVAAATSDAAATTADANSAAVSNAGTVFDAGTVHSISVEFGEAEYDNMIETYGSTGEKECVEATVTIDGTTYEQAGIRLKGNSSLRGITGGGGGNAGDALRLVIEHPDDVWMADNFDESGALYKAESTGDHSYRGDDPEAYDEVFDQEAGKDNTDLTPLIEFLDLINNSDDATFGAELGEHLDVDAFATYLAMQEIVDNFDDIDGPGNNSYLYYDTATGRFTVVPWDYNLAFGAITGGGGFTAPPVGGQFTPPGDGEFTPAEDGQFTPPGDGEFAPPGDGEPRARPVPDGVPDLGEFAAGGSPFGGSNILVERFLAVDEFAALHADRSTQLEELLIDSGLAQSILDERTNTLQDGAADLVAADVIATEATTLSESL